MDDIVLSKGKKLLLMGSKAFQDRELPQEVKRLLDDAIAKKMTIIVGEAKGASRLYQDYLHSQQYGDVIVGHARSLRYNAGNWSDIKYGDTLSEREKRMIEACDTAIVIWMNKSSVIATNLERLKELQKPTYLYECSNKSQDVYSGPLDPNRIYDLFFYQKLQKEKRKRGSRQHTLT